MVDRNPVLQLLPQASYPNQSATVGHLEAFPVLPGDPDRPGVKTNNSAGRVP